MDYIPKSSEYLRLTGSKSHRTHIFIEPGEPTATTHVEAMRDDAVLLFAALKIAICRDLMLAFRDHLNSIDLSKENWS